MAKLDGKVDEIAAFLMTLSASESSAIVDSRIGQATAILDWDELLKWNRVKLRVRMLRHYDQSLTAVGNRESINPRFESAYP